MRDSSKPSSVSAARIDRRGQELFADAGVIDHQRQQPDRGPTDRGDHDFVPWRANAEDVHDARDQRLHADRVVAEQIVHPDLDHDAPQQRAGQDEDLLLDFRNGAGALDRPHDDEIGDVGGEQAGDDADRGAAVRPGAVIGGDIPAEQRGDQHDAAMREIEHAADAEHQREPDGAQAVQRADREPVDQDLQGEHGRFRLTRGMVPDDETSIPRRIAALRALASGALASRAPGSRCLVHAAGLMDPPIPRGPKPSMARTRSARSITLRPRRRSTTTAISRRLAAAASRTTGTPACSGTCRSARCTPACRPATA